MTEANTARVKRQRAAPIKVIIANPPYNAGQLNENDNNKSNILSGDGRQHSQKSGFIWDNPQRFWDSSRREHQSIYQTSKTASQAKSDNQLPCRPPGVATGREVSVPREGRDYRWSEVAKTYTRQEEQLAHKSDRRSFRVISATWFQVS